MIRRARPGLAAAVLWLTAACGGGASPTAQDAATDAVHEAAHHADTAVDAPRDVADVADVADDVASDVGTDATATPDAMDATSDGPPDDFVAIVPCPDPGAYTAATPVSTTIDNRYAPACVRVVAGATVTIEASAHHPLEPRSGGSAGNPIPTQNAPATVSFPVPGFYPFLCPEHVDQGMLGVVWVTTPQ